MCQALVWNGMAVTDKDGRCLHSCMSLAILSRLLSLLPRSAEGLGEPRTYSTQWALPRLAMHYGGGGTRPVTRDLGLILPLFPTPRLHLNRRHPSLCSGCSATSTHPQRGSVAVFATTTSLDCLGRRATSGKPGLESNLFISMRSWETNCVRVLPIHRPPR